MPRKPDAIKWLALNYLLAHVGETVTRAGIEHYVREHRSATDDKPVTAGEVTRRVRELRQEHGYDIDSEESDIKLKSGEYRLNSPEPGPAMKRASSLKQRARILEMYGSTCVRCGIGANDPDPYEPGKKIKLVLDHIRPLNDGGTNDDDNFQVLCNNCNAGKKAFYNPTKATRNLLAEIRGRPLKEQREVYAFLKRKFEGIEVG